MRRARCEHRARDAILLGSRYAHARRVLPPPWNTRRRTPAGSPSTQQSVSALLRVPADAARRLRLRAWRRGRHGARLHGRLRRRPGRSRHRHAALPVPVHGTGLEAARCAARAHAAVRAAVAEAARPPAGAAAVRRRQVLRRAHDVAGAGRCRRCRGCAGWSSSASRCIRPASRPTNAPAPRRGRLPDALPARHARRTGRGWRCCSRCSRASAHAPRWRWSTMPTTPSTSGRAAAATTRRRWWRCST